MTILKSKPLSLLQVLWIFVLGLACGVQVALYLYDYYDDGIADITSLLIGVGMIAASVAFIIFSFRDKRGGTHRSDQGRA